MRRRILNVVTLGAVAVALAVVAAPSASTATDVAAFTVSIPTASRPIPQPLPILPFKYVLNRAFAALIAWLDAGVEVPVSGRGGF